MFTIDDVRALKDRTGCSLYHCNKAFEFCELHPECLPEAYLRVFSQPVVRKQPFLECVRIESMNIKKG